MELLVVSIRIHCMVYEDTGKFGESVFGRKEPSVLFLFKLLALFCCLFVCFP